MYLPSDTDKSFAQFNLFTYMYLSFFMHFWVIARNKGNFQDM